MSWSHSSRLGLAVVVILALAAVGVASGVTVQNESVPEEAAVDEEVTVSVEVTDLYADSSTWTFDGQTALEDATWTIEQRRNGQVVASDTFQGSSLPNTAIQLNQSASDAPDTLVVEITGSVPDVQSFSYVDPATFRAAQLARVTGSGPTIFSEYQVHHYTTGDPGSRGARTALDDAQSAIQSAEASGNDVSQARSTFQDAVSAYDNGNFAEAVSLAEEAQSQAQSSGSDGSGSDGGSSGDGTDDSASNGTDSGATNDTQSGSQSGTNGSDAGQGGNESGTDDGTTDGSTGDGNASAGGGSDDGGLLRIVLYGLLGLLILGAVGGGAYWYLQRSQGPSRDPLG